MAAPINLQANLQLNTASINASAKQVQQALGRITGQASEFQKSLDASTARVFAFGATTAVIAGVGTAFKSLVRTTISVQEELIKMNAILGASQKEFGAFREAVFDAAKSTGQSFQTVAAGAQELARQGLNAVETSKRLEAAMILTRISGLGAEASVKALTAAINGFQSAGLTAADVTNKLVAVDTRFAVSAEDLAQGFSRAGSTAEDAGVSFEQLLGLITAVEQKTARGGAVIGNAFKSIFTRLSRGDTIAELQELGVAIDANQSGVQKLEALSKAIEGISDPTRVSQIKELAGGVYQINVVSAALKDLSSETSIYKQATDAAAKAGNDAFERNAELSKSLASQINQLVVTVTNFAEKIGSITFGPLLEDLVGLATKFSDLLNKALDGDGIGSTFIQGFFGVIGKFLSGPALVLFGAAFAKIFSMVTKFAADGFKSIMQIGTATERVKGVQSGIISLLQQDDNLRKLITSTTVSQATKEAAVLAAIKNQNTALTQQKMLMESIAASAMRAGVTGFSSSSGTFSGRKGRFAAGLNPYAAEEMDAMMLGATPDVRAYKTNLKGHGPAIVNDQEDIINIGGKDAVIPRYPTGYRMGDLNKLSPKQLQAALATNKFGQSSAAVQAYGNKLQQAGGYAAMKKKEAQAQLPFLNVNSEYGMIVPEIGKNETRTLFVSEGAKGVVGTDQQGPNTVAKVQVPIYRLNKSAAKAKTGEKLVNEYTKKFTSDSLKFAHSISGGELPKPKTIADIAKTLNKGSATSAAGSVFESGIASMLQDNDFKDFKKRAAGSLMDFKGDSVTKLRGGGGRPINPFGIPPITKGLEAKYSSSLATGAAEKIYKIQGLGKKAFQYRGKGKAAGHIPRFARGSGFSSRGYKLPNYNPNMSASSTSNRISDGGGDDGGKGGANYGLSFAMSGLAQVMSGLAATTEDAKGGVGDFVSSVGGMALQFGSMGMAINPFIGGIGLAAGALIGLKDYIKDNFGSGGGDNLSPYERKVRSSQVSVRTHMVGAFTGGMTEGEMMGQASVNAANGMEDLTEKLEKARKATVDYSEGVTDSDRAVAADIYKDLVKQFAQQQKNAPAFEQVQAELRGLKQSRDFMQQNTNRQVARRQATIANEGFYNDSRQTLLGGMRGPLAASLRSQASTTKDLMGISTAQEAKRQAENLLAATPTGAQNYDAVFKAAESAGDKFREKIAQAATNMQSRMNAIADRQKEIALEVDQTRLGMVRDSLGFLGASMTSPVVRQEGLSQISGVLKSDTATASDKGTAALELTNMLSGIPKALQDVILKQQGLDSRDLTKAGLQNLFGGQLDEAQLNEYTDIIQAEDNKKLEMLSQEEAALSTEMNALTVKFRDLKDNFDIDGIVTNIENMNTQLLDASTNLGAFAVATTTLAQATENVIASAGDIAKIVDANAIMMDTFKVKMEELEKKAKELGGKGG